MFVQNIVLSLVGIPTSNFLMHTPLSTPNAIFSLLFFHGVSIALKISKKNIYSPIFIVQFLKKLSMLESI